MRSVTVSINLLIGAPPSISDDELADRVLSVLTEAGDHVDWCDGIEVYIDDIEELDSEAY